MKQKNKIICINCIMAMLLLSCQNDSVVRKELTPTSDDLLMIINDSDSLILGWENENDTSIAKYELSYRSYEDVTLNWILLKSDISASNEPRVTIRRSEIEKSISTIVFAIVAVDNNGNKSQYHQSIEPTASPSKGWYLLWDAKH